MRRCAEVLKCRNVEVSRCRGADVPKCRGADVPKCRGAEADQLCLQGVAPTLPLRGGTSFAFKGWHQLYLEGVAPALPSNGGTYFLERTGFQIPNVECLCA